jgi:hypothetical protein
LVSKVSAAGFVALGVGLAAVVATSVSLPLRRGPYVEMSSGCAEAPNSARSWFGGGFVIQHPHAHCAPERAMRLGHNRYEIIKSCVSYGSADKRHEVRERVWVLNRTEYILSNRFGRFHAHWCRA